MTHDDSRAACVVSVDPDPVAAVFAQLAAGLAPASARRDLRANALLYMRGLLMPGMAGNCWSLAEAAGLDRPYRLQHLLERASWDEDAARDAVRSFLVRYLGADGGVLIFDETGQAKKGTATATADCGTTALTVPEAQRLFHLFTMLAGALPTCTTRAQIALHLRWSDWRRRHQARARWHHCRTRLPLIA